jgi:hypothetical protein
MRGLRPFSDRPWKIVDPWGFDIIDPVTRARIGFQPVARPQGFVTSAAPTALASNSVLFTYTGGYVAPLNLVRAVVECTADDYAREEFTAAQIGSSQPVLIGGGFTAFGSLVKVAGSGSCIVTEYLRTK